MLKFKECQLIKHRGKVMNVINARSVTRKADPLWLRSLHKLPYDKDDDVMSVLISYILEDQQGIHKRLNMYASASYKIKLMILVCHIHAPLFKYHLVWFEDLPCLSNDEILSQYNAFNIIVLLLKNLTRLSSVFTQLIRNKQRSAVTFFGEGYRSVKFSWHPNSAIPRKFIKRSRNAKHWSSVYQKPLWMIRSVRKVMELLSRLAYYF